jgi:predicted phosphoribosyltransferase
MHAHASRASAGRTLATALGHHAHTGAIVLGIPRGGVVVAAQLSGRLDAALDVLVVRETSIGMYVEGCRADIDLERVIELEKHAIEVTDEIQHEQAAIELELALFRGHRPFPPLAGRTTILVDDGSASTRMLAAALANLRARGAQPLVLGLPVADPETGIALRDRCDELVVLARRDPRGLECSYRELERVGDLDLVVLLTRGRYRRPANRQRAPA